MTLSIRVTPNAGVDRIEGAELRGNGDAVLRVRVAAVPDKGKANAAVVALLAGALTIPKSSIALVAGETARFKLLAIIGDGPALAAQLDTLL